MINLRYYIILLIGVFLSLGLGMLIGISLESKNIIGNQQVLIAKQIEEEFIGIRQETKQLKEKLMELEKEKEQYELLAEQLFATTVEDRLNGLKVSLINMSGNNSDSDVIKLLQLSGATVESNISFGSKFLDSGKELESIIGTYLHPAYDGMDFYKYIAEDLISSLYNGSLTPLIHRLSQLHLIENFKRIENGCDVIIIEGKGRHNNISEISPFEIKLIEAAKNMGLDIVAVETYDIVNTAIPEYKKLNISTVDNVDTLFGKLALVSILAGNTGNYGIKDGAQGLLPDPLFIPRLTEEFEESIDTHGSKESESQMGE